ncbi:MULTISPECIES: DUF1800 domain-containing protein [Paracoccus]|uniref:DUF1800 domain-containing protein n=1 Tax=Paracoccus TaxID=265 RepID=UPI00086B1CE1|nr:MULTISPECIES: DUF1800 domain-containing protein [Paracoccus]ODT60554.1 MAG: hypothetical protein ABS73_05245 [Paracoccus sp. SCN 68-21]
MIPYDQLAAIRLGYGLSPRLTPPADPSGVAASVIGATQPDPQPVTLDQVRDWQQQGQVLGAEEKQGGGDEARQALRDHRQTLRAVYAEAVVTRFARAVDDPSGFGERLTWFWADHFTVTGGTIYLDLLAASLVQEAIRPHLAGRFADMMVAAETHPAMLRYLDQARSLGPNSIEARKNPDKPAGANENMAREMIELHSLGVGGAYEQGDVEQLALLLTGLTYNPRQPGVFRPARAEPGAETVLGDSYGGGKASIDDIRAVIEALATHPDTARHLARKLAVHFVADDPPPALIERLSGVYRDTGGDLGAMNLALAKAPELRDSFRTKMRQPFEFLVASLRALGLDGAGVRALSGRDRQALLMQPLAVMGQPWAAPPGPDGWPEPAAAWASPQGLAMRITWAMTHPATLSRPLPDARAFLRTTLGDTASEALAWAVPRAESQAEGVALVLASSDFNRR